MSNEEQTKINLMNKLAEHTMKTLNVTLQQISRLAYYDDKNNLVVNMNDIEYIFTANRNFLKSLKR